MARRLPLVCFVALASLALLACCAPRAQPAAQPLRWLPLDEEGWSILRPAKDTRLIYVSSSSGDDATARAYSPGDPAIGADPFRPRGPLKPFKTAQAALAHARNGYPEWVLFKRGDVWDEPLGSPPSGRSPSAPLVIAAYGAGERRPQFRLRGSQRAIRFPIHADCHDIAIVGLEFYAPEKDPRSPEFSAKCRVKTALELYVSEKPTARARRLLIEDCCFRFCGATLMVARGRKREAAPATEQLVFRRNLVLDNYARDSHCQGMYAARISILLEENIFDHNGWLIRERGNRKDRGGATMFNHNTYFTDCHDVVFRGNMFLRASSIGNKWTANSGPASARNLVMEDNLYVEGEIGISIGGNADGPRRFRNVKIANNVFLHIGRGRPTLRSLGWGIDVRDWDGGTIAGNILVHHPAPGVNNVHTLSIEASPRVGLCRDVVVRGNVFCGAPVLLRNTALVQNVVFANNRFLMPWEDRALISAQGELRGFRFAENSYWSRRPAGEWFALGGKPVALARWAQAAGEQRASAVEPQLPQPQRTIENYMAHLALEPSFEAFLAEVRRQSRANWRREFTAAAVNGWVRRGYGLAKAALQAGPGG